MLSAGDAVGKANFFAVHLGCLFPPPMLRAAASMSLCRAISSGMGKQSLGGGSNRFLSKGKSQLRWRRGENFMLSWNKVDSCPTVGRRNSLF